MLNIGENLHGQLPRETFLYFWYNNSVEHLLTVAYLNMLLCFQSKISFNRLFWLLFWFSSAILHSKTKSLFLKLYTSPQWVTSLLQLPIYHMKCVLIYKSKRFSLVKLWYTIWAYRAFKLQSNNIKKHPSHIYSFWNCLSRNLLSNRIIIIITLL